MTFDWQTPLALMVVALAAAHLLRGAVASWRGERGGCGSCPSGKGGGQSCGSKSEPAVVTLGGLRPPLNRATDQHG